MDKRTFFKTPEGNLYSVSEKVMEIGHIPAEGVVYASNEEIEAYNKREERVLSLEELDSLLENKMLSEDHYKTLLVRIKEQEIVENKKKRLAEIQLVSEFAKQERMAKRAINKSKEKEE